MSTNRLMKDYKYATSCQ
uniref:Uncharacterized protein n=1 Tax=Anguilla anguilla TaxID=7936 RepID=A0A0E9VPL2_ANGAN